MPFRKSVKVYIRVLQIFAETLHQASVLESQREVGGDTGVVIGLGVGRELAAALLPSPVFSGTDQRAADAGPSRLRGHVPAFEVGNPCRAATFGAGPDRQFGEPRQRSVVTFLYIDFWMEKDTFHQHAEDIYQLGNVIAHGDNEAIWSSTPIPLGPVIKEKCPSVDHVTRLSNQHVTMISDEDVFAESAFFVERDFFDMFSFPFVAGDAATFDDPNSLYLTETSTTKYFGDADPIGGELELLTSNGHRQLMTVKGVLADQPSTSSLHFNMLLPFDNITRWDIAPVDNWEHWARACFIQMRPGEDPAQLRPILEPYLDMQREVNGDWGVARLDFYNLLALTREHVNLRNGVTEGHSSTAGAALSAIAIVLMLLAGFNYTNNRLVSLSTRFREIGIRKVVGGSRTQLVWQFIGENVVFVLIALIAGILLAVNVLIPALDHLFGGGWSVLTLRFAPRTILFLASLLAVTSLGAGLYPAIIAAKFAPVKIFRGPSGMKGQTLFVRIMIGFQFALTLLAIIIPAGLYLNARYQMTLDWGYQQEGVLCVPVTNGDGYARLANELQSNPAILSLAGSRDHIGRFINVAAVEVGEFVRETNSMQVGPNYLETLGMQMLQGRTFGTEPRDDQQQEVVVNQTFMDEYGLTFQPGMPLVVDDETYTVIGVADDFHTWNFESRIQPMVIRVVPEDQFKYMVLRLPEGRVVETAEEIKQVFRRALPELPYHGFFQDELFDHFYRGNMAALGVFTFSGGSALLIAIMGLIGLVSATLQKRQKEIGIRKVLGATVTQIVQLITRPIGIILLIGSLLALVPGYLLLKMMLTGVYEYHIDITAVPFVFSLVVLLVVSLGTVILLSVRTALSNPVNSIRNE